MPIKKLIPVFLLAMIAGAAVYWQSGRSPQASADLVLYGNVDLRQVSLAFPASERITAMRVQEGDRVTQGQVLAELDTRMLNLRIDQAQAQIRVQEQSLNRLLAGSRDEEIAQARAAVAAADAEHNLARQQLQRLNSIATASNGRAVSELDIEGAQARLAVTQANLERVRQAEQLTIAGPAAEDIARAQAVVDAARAELAVLNQQLSDTQLRAPMNAVVRSRLLEPGDMASPQRPAYTLTIDEPKWVRAYVSEPNLGRVAPGQAASITTDSHPDQALSGQIGYIASVAEFTPRTVQTEDLRTSLVYEIRILANDPDNRLRQGMPATVRIIE